MEQRQESQLLMTKLEETSRLIQRLMEKLTENDRKLTILQTKFDGLKERFEEITKILHGNGGGIEVKTAIVEKELSNISQRLSSIERHRSELAKENRKGLIAIVIAIISFLGNLTVWLIQKLIGS